MELHKYSIWFCSDSYFINMIKNKLNKYTLKALTLRGTSSFLKLSCVKISSKLENFASEIPEVSKNKLRAASVKDLHGYGFG